MAVVKYLIFFSETLIIKLEKRVKTFGTDTKFRGMASFFFLSPNSEIKI